MNEKLIKYLKIQVATGKLTRTEVINKYPSMEQHLESEEQLMENITITQIVGILGIIAGLITSITTICIFCKKVINKRL